MRIIHSVTKIADNYEDIQRKIAITLIEYVNDCCISIQVIVSRNTNAYIIIFCFGKSS